MSTLDVKAIQSIVKYICNTTETKYIDKAADRLKVLIPRGSDEEILQALVNIISC